MPVTFSKEEKCEVSSQTERLIGFAARLELPFEDKRPDKERD